METVATAEDFAYAPWPRRMLSSFVDLLVLTVATVPFVAPMFDRNSEALDTTFSRSEWAVLTIFSIVLQVAYMTGMHAWRGATVGKMATGTVLLREDGEKVSLPGAFTRSVALVGINFVSSFLFFVPFVFSELRPLWHRRRQTLHDSFARTIVVVRPPSYPPPAGPPGAAGR